jgi:hypothetical protein
VSEKTIPDISEVMFSVYVAELEEAKRLSL